MKKAIIFAVCATLALSAVGCKNYKDEKSAPDTKVETKDEKSINGAEKTEKQEADKKTEVNEDITTSSESSAETPVLESAEELEGMVNEFNTTEDPERKEELRKQLEAFLSQAEAAVKTAE